jgi:hypothetical protein
MITYYYQLPLAKGSTKQILISDESGEPIYSMQRTYKSILHHFFDLWIGKNQVLCEYEGYDQQGNLLAQCHKKHSLTKRSKTIIKMNNAKIYTAEIDGIDAITPTYIIVNPAIKLVAKIDFNRHVKFYEDGQVVAKLQLYFSSNKKSELIIDEQATIQNPLFYSILTQVFYFVGEY